ncbi:MAG TPA: hypothetical protein VGQ17_05025 [Gemmatimonadales bacterium]|jgi:hypothetical protein|nr:hypothetical protein [Gemmatimonadales bacterium]
MVIGRRVWIGIWYGILLLGVLGLWSSIYWGRQAHWKNLDEVLRSVGTILVSAGMLLLLYGVAVGAGQLLLVASLLCFLFALVWGRKHPLPAAPPEEADEEPLSQPRNGA